MKLAALTLVFAIGILFWPLKVQSQTHDPSRWHAPGFGHEHGDPPPQWLTDWYTQNSATIAPYWGPELLYDGPFNTSAAENTTKHFAFKGMHLEYPTFQDRDGGWLDGYIIGHISGTPMDRGAMVHSFRAFIIDAGGGLTIRQGWVNMGSPETARVPRRCALVPPGGSDCTTFGDPNQRPIVLAITPDDASGTYQNGRSETFEQWYGFGAGFSWGWGLNTPTFFQATEKATDTDSTQWHPVGGQAHGQLRSIEVVGGKPSGIPAGGVAFWMTPEGAFVADPSAVECNGKCLLQYISGTYKGVTGRYQTTYPIPTDVGVTN